MTQDSLESCQQEIARLKSELAKSQAEVLRREISGAHASNARISLLASLRLCRVMVDDDFKVRHIVNALRVIGASDLNVPIANLFGTPSARRYFDDIRSLSRRLPELAAPAEAQPWTQVCPAEKDAESGFLRWLTRPQGGWEIQRDLILSKELPHTGEYFLASPHEIIGAEDDFRIEYMCCTSTLPRDLSVVVGGKLEVTPRLNEYKTRPEDVGYCFAFGAMHNSCTELQRLMLTVASAGEARIVPGRNHHCVAERIGGLLRFLVDGKEVYRYLDPLPLLGKGSGYVTLYTCGPDHVFWDLKIFTRPTCLPAETRERIEGLRRVTLEAAGGARFVEAYCLRRDLFAFKDVTEAIETHRKLEDERLLARDMEDSLARTSMTAYEMNQPLTVVLGQIELIMNAAPRDLPPSLREGLADLKQSSERLADMVRKLSHPGE